MKEVSEGHRVNLTNRPQARSNSATARVVDTAKVSRAPVTSSTSHHPADARGGDQRHDQRGVTQADDERPPEVEKVSHRRSPETAGAAATQPPEPEPERQSSAHHPDRDHSKQEQPESETDTAHQLKGSQHLVHVRPHTREATG